LLTHGYPLRRRCGADRRAVCRSRQSLCWTCEATARVLRRKISRSTAKKPPSPTWRRCSIGRREDGHRSAGCRLAAYMSLAFNATHPERVKASSHRHRPRLQRKTNARRLERQRAQDRRQFREERPQVATVRQRRTRHRRAQGRDGHRPSRARHAHPEERPRHQLAARLKVPSIVVVGETTRRSSSPATYMATEIPNASKAVIRECGPPANIDIPRSVKQSHRRFIGGSPPNFKGYYIMAKQLMATGASTRASRLVFGALAKQYGRQRVSREEMLAESSQMQAMFEGMKTFFDSFDTEEVAPSKASRSRSRRSLEAGQQHDPASHYPSGQQRDAALRLLHPRRRHGGSLLLSTAISSRLGKIIAAKGGRGWSWSISATACSRVRRRRSSVPGRSSTELRLGLKWRRRPTRRSSTSIPSASSSRRERRRQSHLATGLKLLKDGDIGLIKGLYRSAPTSRRVAAGKYPSSTETTASSSICTTIAGPWATATVRSGQGSAGVARLCEETTSKPAPTIISVNECDPLRGRKALSSIACCSAPA